MLNSPALFVAVLLLSFVATFVAVTMAPGMAAPDASVTVPTTLAVIVCAFDVTLAKNRSTAAIATPKYKPEMSFFI